MTNSTTILLDLALKALAASDDLAFLRTLLPLAPGDMDDNSCLRACTIYSCWGLPSSCLEDAIDAMEQVSVTLTATVFRSAAAKRRLVGLALR